MSEELTLFETANVQGATQYKYLPSRCVVPGEPSQAKKQGRDSLPQNPAHESERRQTNLSGGVEAAQENPSCDARSATCDRPRHAQQTDSGSLGAINRSTEGQAQRTESRSSARPAQKHYPEIPGHKVNGTSQESAEKVKSKAETLRDQVLACLKEHPFSTDEVAGLLQESVLSIRPRFSELRALGKIKDSGKRRRNESGHGATIWEVI